VVIDRLAERELRTVMCLVRFPKLLVSLHPDFVIAHLMPLAVARHPVVRAYRNGGTQSR